MVDALLRARARCLPREAFPWSALAKSSSASVCGFACCAGWGQGVSSSL